MKRRHAKGYTEYAKLDTLARHRAYKDGEDSEGTPLCVCSYPLAPTSEEKRKMREIERRISTQDASGARDSERTPDGPAS